MNWPENILEIKDEWKNKWREKLLPGQDEEDEERDKIGDREQKLKKTSVFLGKMLAMGIALRVVLQFRPDTTAIQSWLASVTADILGFLGVDLVVNGALMIGETSSYLVTQDCLGWKSMFAFTALVIASTENLIKDLKTILGGLILIFIANIVRVVTTVYLSYKNIVSFDIIHAIFWKWGLTAIILLIWISWLSGLSGKIKRTFKYKSGKF